MSNYTVLLDLSSESESENVCLFEALCFAALNEQKSENSAYMKKRQSHGEFILTKEFDDEKFTNYFILNRKQFKEVHDFIRNDIEREGCHFHLSDFSFVFR